ncbi:hypothetical protein RJ639_000051 [Escallonia herrerae]|uniref:C2 domain-containing protein n=1 Tax=Escallonia herrerae TaxID=1293975 RepID=A0AA88XAM5_9ASTE|nr:hypothetical protein RJ639_000051 [Escallonia herrerae]
MSDQIPFKLLEINVMSAQDLPPVSKMLRTYVVAWMQPDHKLTTRVDHHGHTNPTWNYKFLFRLDNNFLASDAPAVTIEIYNAAWLRDIPIGTSKLLLHNLFPHSSSCSHASRSVALQICRPSGLLQGTVNLVVRLVDITIPAAPLSLYSELSASTAQNSSSKEDVASKQFIKQRVEGQGNDGYEEMAGDGLGSVVETKVVAGNGSICSVMRPLPSEVAAGLKRGLYSTAGDEVGSSIFDDWTVAGDDQMVAAEQGTKAKVVRWQTDDELKGDSGGDKKLRLKRRSHSDGGAGLFSCFGNAYGYEFTFICGSNSGKKNRKNRLGKSNLHVSHSEEELRRLYT